MNDTENNRTLPKYFIFIMDRKLNLFFVYFAFVNNWVITLEFEIFKFWHLRGILMNHTPSICMRVFIVLWKNKQFKSRVLRLFLPLKTRYNFGGCSLSIVALNSLIGTDFMHFPLRHFTYCITKNRVKTIFDSLER